MQMLLGLGKTARRESRRGTSKANLQILIPIIENILNHRCWLLPARQHAEQIPRLVSLLYSRLPCFTFRMEVSLNYRENLVKYGCRFLKNDRFLVITSQELRINLMHKLLRKRGDQQMGCLLRVSQETGDIELSILCNYSSLVMENLRYLGREITIKMKELLLLAPKYLKIILHEINDPTVHEYAPAKLSNLQKIKRHIYFSSYDLGLSEKASEYRHPSDETLQSREAIIKTLLGNIHGENERGDMYEGMLYGLMGSAPTQNKEWRREFESTYYFEKLLQIPTPKVVNQGENVFIYNEIEIMQPEKAVAQNLPATANSILKVTNIHIRYKNGGEGSNDGGDRKSTLNKLVLIKQGKSDSYRSRTKIFHEKNIVKTFSSAHSGYILKYYNCSQQTFAHRNGLMMDYNPYSVTLADHLTISRDSLSMNSKLHMLAHISNGLRFLTYYKIVHMDLNLSNVLVYDGYLPKIIDFGEAYHSEVVEMETVKQIHYTPGFTLPYCPPEVFTHKVFSSAQDIFSFGVIIFRLLVGMLPFYPGDGLVKIFSDGEYHERWFLAIQRVEEMIRPEVCELLLQLVGRCLRVECEGRPLPIWCTIILKEIISYLYS